MINMTGWMSTFYNHLERFLGDSSCSKCIVLFDIDGTLLDTRHLICNVLHQYDKAFNTSLFSHLDVRHVTCHESNIAPLLTQLNVHKKQHKQILDWFEQKCWEEKTIRNHHQPYPRVFHHIKQLRDLNVDVILVTGRPESYRHPTLESINYFASQEGIVFAQEELNMNPRTWSDGPPSSKRNTAQRYIREGFTILAVFDNEPDSIQMYSELIDDSQTLLMHADTIYKSSRFLLPKSTVSGFGY